LTDGDYRKIENPKLKNIKHIHWTNIKAEEVAKTILEGKQPGNHLIRKNLEEIQRSKITGGKGVW